jgi:hypothetical protein
MGGADFRIGGLYRLVQPDFISWGAVIGAGHGYLWLGEKAGILNAASGANFKSVATGAVIYFHYDEMEQEG